MTRLTDAQHENIVFTILGTLIAMILIGAGWMLRGLVG